MFKNSRFTKLLPAVLIMILIFLFSAQQSEVSSEISGALTQKILALLAKIFTSIEAENWEVWHGLVRKNAHFFGYFVLALLSRRGFKAMGYKHFNRLAFVLCIVYAMTDEFHQLFVPGRSAELRDVFIDAAGAALGLLVAVAVSRLVKRSA